MILVHNQDFGAAAGCAEWRFGLCAVRYSGAFMRLQGEKAGYEALKTWSIKAADCVPFPPAPFRARAGTGVMVVRGLRPRGPLFVGARYCARSTTGRHVAAHPCSPATHEVRCSAGRWRGNGVMVVRGCAPADPASLWARWRARSTARRNACARPHHRRPGIAVNDILYSQPLHHSRILN